MHTSQMETVAEHQTANEAAHYSADLQPAVREAEAGRLNDSEVYAAEQQQQVLGQHDGTDVVQQQAQGYLEQGEVWATAEQSAAAAVGQLKLLDVRNVADK